MSHGRIVAMAVLLLAFVTSTRAQSGLAGRQPIGAFLNGTLPSNIAESGYTVVEAFPSLRFKDPNRVVPRPGTTHLWVLCQDGEIWAVDTANPTSKSLVLDLKSVCVGHEDGEGDSGLLGIAFHPQFGQAGSSKRGHVYLWYSYRQASVGYHPHSYNRLSRFNLADGASTISTSSEVVLINQYDRKTWHNGGEMFFGADGFLYLANGDEGDNISGGGAESNSQKINDGLFSGVLRIDVDMDATKSHAIRRQPRNSANPPGGWPGSYSQNYFVPNDNPWLNSGGAYLEEFFAIGLRSPHSLTYDPVSGAAFVCDTGRDQQEEINVLAKGANYQWAFLEGTATGPLPGTIGPGTSTPPFHTITLRTVDGSALIGGRVYRGSAFAADLGGRYVFGDFISNKVWALDWQTPGATRRWLATIPRQTDSTGVTAISADAAGDLLITTHGSQGRIYKLVSTGATGTPPATLSATQAFTDLITLTPAPGIVPYTVNAALWSDGAEKKRWIALPNNGAPYDATEKAAWSATGSWSFPTGTVTIKHFEIATSETNPTLRKRLETRFLVRTQQGWYGITYRWRADGTDADLVPANGSSETFNVTLSGGSTRTQRWNYPSRENCMGCHTTMSGFALGVNTRQLNGNLLYPSTGITANQLATWSAIGLLDTTLSGSQIAGAAKLSALTDSGTSLTQRMRSYLDANCSHCHRPGGVQRANFDARYDTPSAQQGIINGDLVNGFGISGSKVVASGDVAKSLMHLRMNSTDHWVQMPPIARNEKDTLAMTVLQNWIAELGGATNSAPALTQPANQSTTRGSAASLQLLASDVDGDTLFYSASGLPVGLSINSTTGLISGTVSASAASTNTVVVTVSDASLSQSRTFTWSVTDVVPPSTTLLTPVDIGPVFAAGTTTYQSGSGVFTVSAFGSQVWGTADDFHFAHRSLTGDGEIRARVTGQNNTNEWAGAGLMIRESLSTGSRHVFAYITPAHGYGMTSRSTTGGTSVYQGGPALNTAPNNWLRLMRSGYVITAQHSANGTAWSTLGTVTLTSLNSTVNIGIAVCSALWNSPATVTIDSLALTLPPDDDNDGLRDAWELTHWPATTGHGAMDDHDRDGYVELLELALGLNPTQPNAGGLPSVTQENGRLTMTLTKQAGVTYEIQSAGTLATGQPDSFSAMSTTVLINDNTTLKARDNVPMVGATTRFMRVRVIAAP